MEKVFLAPDIFFRNTPEGDVVLYQTSLQKVYLLDGKIFKLLKAIQSYSDVKKIFTAINKDMPEEIGEDAFNETLQQLFQNGILTKETVLEERKKSLEASIKMSQYDKGNSLYAVQFELTFRCNERCKHCYCPRDCEVENELTTEEIKKIIDDLYKMNVVELTFTGGDLFVRQDTFEIMEYAYSLGFVINIFTNGTLLKDEDFFRLKKLYPRSVHFSIYNYIAEKHDAFTCLPGSFEKTVGAIKKCKLLGLPVNIKVSLVEDNYDDIDGIINLARELGTTIQISLQVTPTNSGDMKSTKLRINNVKKYAEVMKKIDNHILLSCAGDFVSDIQKAENGTICGAGAFSLNINPYGEVFPCNALLLSCGNVRNASIIDIWNHSEVLNTVRNYKMSQLKGCENCPDKSYCDFCPGSAMQETGNPLNKYSEACTLTEAKIKKSIKEGK